MPALLKLQSPQERPRNLEMLDFLYKSFLKGQPGPPASTHGTGNSEELKFSRGETGVGGTETPVPCDNPGRGGHIMGQVCSPRVPKSSSSAHPASPVPLAMLLRHHDLSLHIYRGGTFQNTSGPD